MNFLRKIFKTFRGPIVIPSDDTCKPIPEKAIVYHEDDDKMVELLPYSCIQKIMPEMLKIEKFSNDHFDGYGFSDIYIRKDIAELKNIGIRIQEIDDILIRLGYPKQDHFYSVHGSPYSPESFVKNLFAFGNRYVDVFYNYADDIVTDIWFTQMDGFEQDKFIGCIQEISKKWDLVLCDWFALKIIDTRSGDELQKYLNLTL